RHLVILCSPHLTISGQDPSLPQKARCAQTPHLALDGGSPPATRSPGCRLRPPLFEFSVDLVLMVLVPLVRVLLPRYRRGRFRSTVQQGETFAETLEGFDGGVPGPPDLDALQPDAPDTRVPPPMHGRRVHRPAVSTAGDAFGELGEG